MARGRFAAEEVFEDVPLGRIGVLEFVDEAAAVGLADLLRQLLGPLGRFREGFGLFAGSGFLRQQRIAQSQDQVVESHRRFDGQSLGDESLQGFAFG